VEPRYLLYFATVAEQQSFTRASEKLHIAQSAISQQIKTLEEELQVRLLLRTKRSVKLTAAGQAFLRGANDILNRFEESKMEARRAARGETGAPSFGFFKTGSFFFLPELIHAYRTHYPSVRIDLHEQKKINKPKNDFGIVMGEWQVSSRSEIAEQGLVYCLIVLSMSRKMMSSTFTLCPARM
jgi:DNA-binding transcriptional LysR family regulator